MAVSGKCLVKDCPLAFDDAEYIDDAVAKLRAHYRTDHPRKAFYEQRYIEDLEIYNCTLDEHIDRYVGIPDWENNVQNNVHVISACQQILRYPHTYNPELLADATALIVRLGGQPQQPQQPRANANPFDGGIVQAAQEIAFVDDLPPEEPF